MNGLRDATADELKALFQEFLNERARELNLMVPEPELTGKALHDAKNAPWINGMYSKLVFPKYEYRAFPKMLFNAGYVTACEKYERVVRMRIRQDQQQDYIVWLADAQRDKDEATKTVRDARELEMAWAQGWRESPQAAVDWQKALDAEIAQAAAESAYADRHMGEKAKAERERFDERADEHVVDVPAPKKPGPRTRTTEPVGA
jgi:hypothetical protein